MFLLKKLTIAASVFIVSVNVMAAPIVVTGAATQSVASDGTTSDIETDTSTTFGTRTVEATLGGMSSTTGINWVEGATGALFDYDLAHARSASDYVYASSEEQSLRFDATADTTYSLSGLYSVADSGDPGTVIFEVKLVDLTLDEVLFHDRSHSENTTNESFALGDTTDGDVGSFGGLYNFMQGSLTGALVYQHQYDFYFKAITHAYPEGNGSASASGCVTLSIGSASGAGSCGVSVPSPAPIGLYLIGLALLGWQQRARPVSS